MTTTAAEDIAADVLRRMAEALATVEEGMAGRRLDLKGLTWAIRCAGSRPSDILTFCSVQTAAELVEEHTVAEVRCRPDRGVSVRLYRNWTVRSPGRELTIAIEPEEVDALLETLGILGIT